MNAVLLLLLAWGAAGLGAVAGSILGNAAGKYGLFAGAIVGGILGLVAAAALAAKLRWSASEDRRAALTGGIIGFAVATPIAATNVHTPVIPVLACGLTGIGAVLGVRLSRKRSPLAG